MVYSFIPTTHDPQPMTFLLDFLFPPQCLNCNAVVAAQGTLCLPCWQRMRFITDHYCVNAVGVDIAFQDKMANYPEEHPQELKLLEGGIRDYKHYEPHEYAIELLFAVKEYAKERETEIRAAHPGLDPKAISQMLDSQMTESFGELWAKRKEVDFEIQAEAFASLAKRKGAMAARAFAQRVGFEPVVGAWSEAADTEQEGVKRNI